MNQQGHNLISALEQAIEDYRRRHIESGPSGLVRPDSEGAIESIATTGDIALRFGRVERITRHPDGQRPETDTDHTVMLGLIACSFAARFIPELDIGHIARLALVHDLVEAYAGDVPTLHELGAEAKELKAQTEDRALALIRLTTPELPWIADEIHEYEKRGSAEAIYVWAMDKCMPKITYILNRGVVLHHNGMTAQALRQRLDRQRAQMQSQIDTVSGIDLSPVIDLHAELSERELWTFET